MGSVKRILVLSMMMCLFSAVAFASAFRMGDQGSEVAEIQGQLASLGYDVAADGDFGPATAEAIKSFQSSRGLEADGLVGPSTYSALMGRSMPQVSRSSNYISRRVVANSMNYLGVPYVFGGTSPSGFDCSGYVCWVYNQNGYDVGRTTANGLWQKSQHISEAEAKPGDLVFFKGTYDTTGMSHTGIYLGNGMMVSAGDPIKYANIHSSYWEKHLAGFGRLSK